ncbi:MAG: thiamine pyrophosphate-binding protein [Gammaproteobacteria bacterium]|nr:thiamine pyrophosphate-binding protein [Gammaproteobacteria bacterium]
MKIRGGMLLARALQEKGVQQVFTLSGGFCNPALEGFMDCGIPVINAPSEQAAGHLADGYTRITRKPAVCLVGPEGFAAAVPAMMEAWGERSPVIFVTGSSTLKRQGSGGFKEIDDVSIAAPLTKYSVSITDGERISEFVDRAWKIALSGYPGAVHLSMPADIMFSSYEEDAMRDERPFDRSAGQPPRAWPCPQDLERVLDAVGQAQKPIIIGGHGIWWSGAESALEDCARRLNIPVFNVPYHQKLLSEASDVYIGLADLHQYHPSKQALAQSDLVIMVGARLDNQMNFGNPPLFPASTRLICVNGSHEEIEMNRAADLALLSDPAAFFAAVGELEAKAPAWIEANRAWRARWVEDMIADIPQLDNDRIHPLQLVLEVQNAMADFYLAVNRHFQSGKLGGLRLCARKPEV